jgi:hypothetical protein
MLSDSWNMIFEESSRKKRLKGSKYVQKASYKLFHVQVPCVPPYSSKITMLIKKIK